MLVHSPNELSRLLHSLRSEVRRIPIIVVTQNRDKTAPVLVTERLQKLLNDMGAVRTLSGTARTHFNRAMQVHGLRRGARLYEPTYQHTDPQSKHPFWSEEAIEQVGEAELVQIIYEHCKAVAKRSQAGRPPLAVFEPRPSLPDRPRRPLLTPNKLEDFELPQAVESRAD